MYLKWFYKSRLLFLESATLEHAFCKEKASLYLNVWWSQAEKPPNIELSHGFFLTEGMLQCGTFQK